MDKKYVAFDLEIVKDVPQFGDWKANRPLGIACAVTWASDAYLPDRFYHCAVPHRGGEPGGGAMSQAEAAKLVRHLQGWVAAGYTLLTFNGLSFDFDILAEESGLVDECAELAMHHTDVMFQFFCTKGFAIGLDKVAKGSGLPGKTPGMNGALVPQMWADGEYEEVLAYCTNDVRTLLDLVAAVNEAGEIRWISQSGRPNTCPIPSWLSVLECLALPEPDVSHMRDPWPRAKFTDWLGERLPKIAPDHVHAWMVVEMGDFYQIRCQCGEVYAPRNLLRLLAKDDPKGSGQQVVL